MPDDEPVAEPRSQEPEVTGVIPLEPEQFRHVIEQRVYGKTVTGVGSFRSQRDGKQRLLIALEDGSGLMVAPGSGPDTLMVTLVEHLADGDPA